MSGWTQPGTGFAAGDGAMRTRNRWTASLAAAALLLTAAVSAFGYTGEVPATATVSVAGTVACSDTFAVSSTFLDVEGVAVEGLAVDWSFVTTQSSDDTIHDTSTTTNAAGVATTTVTLAAVPGDRRIGVQAGDVSASAVVSQSCAGLTLPRTSTVAPQPLSGVGAGVLLMVVSLVVAASFASTLRRRTHRGRTGPG